MANSYKGYLKQEHPEHFSDSTPVVKAKLNKETLAFMLSMISSDNKEREFETYCREMIRLTVAPNLISQTGPTGGGDSKVDSETFPVDEGLSELMPFSEAVVASGERWAIAISAKADWKPKALSDIRKIKAVEDEFHRGYVKAFFVSNQAIPDKRRAETEDFLRCETGFDVRVFDRNWLINASLSSDKAKVSTVRSLGLSEDFLEVSEAGAADISRRLRLEEIESSLSASDGASDRREQIGLADEASKLTCELEGSEIEIVNTLDRYYRLAKRYGDSVQKGLAVYNYAYRLVGWCDDPDLDLFYERYCELEEITLKDSSRLNVENLITLWTIMKVQCEEGGLQADCDSHARILQGISDSIADDGDRVSTSIEVSMRMLPVKHMQGAEADGLLAEAIDLLHRSQEIRGIDYRIVAEMLQIPDLFEECERYDEAMEILYARMKDDEGAGALAPALYGRADRLQASGRNYEAIRMYTRTLTCIRAHGDKENLLRVCMRLSDSCEEVGLYNLCRNLRVLVLNYSLDAYYGDALLSPFMLLSCNRLKYDELRAGHVQASIKLACLETLLQDMITGFVFGEDEGVAYDQLLAMCLLAVPGEQLDAMPGITEGLEEMGLVASAQMVRYALGYYDEGALEELDCDEAGFDELVENFYESACESFELPRASTIAQGGSIEVSSKLLGCRVEVVSGSSWQHYEAARTLLAALEGFLGTGSLHGLFAYAEAFVVEIRGSEVESRLFDVVETEDGLDVLVGNLDHVSRKEIAEGVRSFLPQALAIFIERVFPMARNPESLEVMANEDFSFERMFLCADSMSVCGDFIDSLPFGIEPEPNEPRSFSRKRKEPLGFVGVREERRFERNPSKEVFFGNAPEEVADPNYHQRNITFSSVIDTPAWDEAEWKGFVYAVSPDGGSVGLGFLFGSNAGRKIFERWIRNGRFDIDRIRVAIIKGIDADNPLSYRVAIGSGLPEMGGCDRNEAQMFTTMTRMRTLDPPSHRNLNLFEDAVKHVRSLTLFPAVLGPSGPKEQMDLCITINSDAVTIMEAHEIKASDYIACTALLPTDNPIIPSDCAGLEIESIMDGIRAMADRRS